MSYHEHLRRPVGMPKLAFMAGPVDDNAAKAEAIIRIRIIRAGRNAFEEIRKAESFEAWEQIGAALAIGKAEALRTSGANAPWGQHYCREFSKWAKEHGFNTMRSGDRSYAIALHENIGTITAWRAGLSDKQRGRLTTAQSNVKRWRSSLSSPETNSPLATNEDLKREAAAAWRRFVASMRLLRPDQAAPLWQVVAAEVATHHIPVYTRTKTDISRTQRSRPIQ
jgi:hypothetical protein